MTPKFFASCVAAHHRTSLRLVAALQLLVAILGTIALLAFGVALDLLVATAIVAATATVFLAASDVLVPTVIVGAPLASFSFFRASSLVPVALQEGRSPSSWLQHLQHLPPLP